MDEIKGSHGSISKAGKIRYLSPKIWNRSERKTKDGNPCTHNKKHKNPRSANRVKFIKRVIKEERSGQRKDSFRRTRKKW